MSRMLVLLLPLLILAGLVLVYVHLRRMFYRAEARVDKVLERARADFNVEYEWLRNLVQVADWYVNQRQDLIDGLQELELETESATMEEIFEHHTLLSDSLEELFEYVEDYPELQEDESFSRIGREVTQAHNQVADDIEDYERAVNWYNEMVGSFPYSLLFDGEPRQTI